MKHKMQDKKIKTANREIKLCICLLSFVILIQGCAALKETGKGIAGISTKVLEEQRKEAIKKRFHYSYDICYKEVRDVFKIKGAYIYALDEAKKMIAVYLSEEDTTPVGIFFTIIDKNNTQIEVSSPASYAKEFISKKIFSSLEARSELEEMEGRPNAKK